LVVSLFEQAKSACGSYGDNSGRWKVLRYSGSGFWNSNGESSEVTMVEFRFGYANFIFNIKLIVTHINVFVVLLFLVVGLTTKIESMDIEDSDRSS